GAVEDAELRSPRRRNLRQHDRDEGCQRGGDPPARWVDSPARMQQESQLHRDSRPLTSGSSVRRLGGENYPTRPCVAGVCDLNVAWYYRFEDAPVVPTHSRITWSAVFHTHHH